MGCSVGSIKLNRVEKMKGLTFEKVDFAYDCVNCQNQPVGDLHLGDWIVVPVIVASDRLRMDIYCPTCSGEFSSQHNPASFIYLRDFPPFRME